MANYGGDQVLISWNSVAGKEAYVTAIGTLETSIVLEKSTPFGVVWDQFLNARLKSMKPITIDGFYDDAAGGPDAIWGTALLGTSSTLLITLGSTKTISVTCIVENWQRTLKVGSLHKFKATLQPTGTVTEA